MKIASPLTICALIAATPVFAEDNRQLGAHEHGVGELDIAFDGGQIAMALRAPGSDIVGFEYAATSAEDRAAVDSAVATLARPLDLFVMPEAAQCSVVQASAALESEHDHDDHDDHAAHKDDAHDHDDHAAHKDDAHDHDDHAAHKEEGHDGHDHDDHAAHKDEGHDGHDHDDHAEAEAAEEGGHTEFHAEYLFDCANPDAITQITFAYFDTFPNALEMEVQLISDAGARGFEVERAEPVLDLRGMF
jgi:hypothetical protein